MNTTPRRGILKAAPEPKRRLGFFMFGHGDVNSFTTADDAETLIPLAKTWADKHPGKKVWVAQIVYDRRVEESRHER